MAFVAVVVAMTRKRVIASKGRLPWHIPQETRLYRSIVANGTVVMGRRTYLQMTKSWPGRRCVVVSSSGFKSPALDVCPDAEQAIDKARSYGDDVFVIGGATLYAATIGVVDRMYISYIKKDYDGDLFFPQFDEREWDVMDRRDYAEFEHVVYVRRRSKY